MLAVRKREINSQTARGISKWLTRDGNGMSRRTA